MPLLNPDEVNFRRFCSLTHLKLSRPDLLSRKEITRLIVTINHLRSNLNEKQEAANRNNASPVSSLDEKNVLLDELLLMATQVSERRTNANLQETSSEVGSSPRRGTLNVSPGKVSPGASLRHRHNADVNKSDQRQRINGGSAVSSSGKTKALSTPNSQATITTTSTTTAVSAERIHSLLQQQKDNVSAAVDSEMRQQEAIEGELAQLTGVLKEATLNINRTVVQQNMTLDAIQTAVEENAEQVQKQKKKMTQREKQGTNSLFAGIGTIVWVFVLFSATYAIMRLLPKPS